MVCGARERLVRRVFGKLHSCGSRSEPVQLTRHEIAELELRLRRLRALGEPFLRTALSSFVDRERTARVSAHVGGECVATEV